MGACMQGCAGCLQKLQELANKDETEENRESGHYDDGEDKDAKATTALKADEEQPTTRATTKVNTRGTSVPTKAQRPTPDPSHRSNHMHTQNNPHNNGYNNSNNDGYGGTTSNTTSPQPAPSSVLNNFQAQPHNNYDRNQYGSVRANKQKNRSPFLNTVATNGAQPYGPYAGSPMSRDSTFGGGGNAVPDHRMLDSHGNVHVNKYYNVTRNHNLSVASKFTDMSEIPSHVADADFHHPGVGLPMSYSQTNTTRLAMHNNASNPYGLAMPPKGAMSLESANSGVLWDDDEFSDQRSVFSAVTETHTQVESRG
eukprot:CAMPEP_0202689778 /NCGR_PEP_ID=MMETSP1385-20130828/4963_1 /ASSEMBLY_ACC=CAM_ASM_000861 /TAXON_ID=933848 /ORGANISM="Elphidium margaritaceum" /LENGTH=310 /DNA_ID=CAMNT_0049344965 /DNA_START=59 /DNA_END=991 /DNA_ORIENTATION=-